MCCAKYHATAALCLSVCVENRTVSVLRKAPPYPTFPTTATTIFVELRPLRLSQAQCQLTPEAEAELAKLTAALAKDEKMLAKVSTERHFSCRKPLHAPFSFFTRFFVNTECRFLV